MPPRGVSHTQRQNPMDYPPKTKKNDPSTPFPAAHRPQKRRVPAKAGGDTAQLILNEANEFILVGTPKVPKPKNTLLLKKF